MKYNKKGCLKSAFLIIFCYALLLFDDGFVFISGFGRIGFFNFFRFNLDDFAVAEGVRICRFGNFRVADGSVGDFFNGFFNHDIRLDRGGS